MDHGKPNELGKPDEPPKGQGAEPLPGDAQEQSASGPVAETPPVMPQTEQIEVEMPEMSAQPAAPTVSIPPFDTVRAENPSKPAEASPDASDGPMMARAQPVKNFMASLLSKANAVLHARKQKKLDRILALAAAKHTISNDDVERALRVSHVTASRYLSQLVKAGKLHMVGNMHRPGYKLPE